MMNLEIDHFENQNIKEVNFHRALLDNLRIKNMFIEHSNFRNTIFHYSIIENSKFKNGIFIMSEFENAYVIDCSFRNCKMDFSNFQDSNVINTNFQDNDMKDVNFQRTILFNTVFKNIRNYHSINFENAYYNEKTRLPDGINPKEKKMIFIDNEISEKHIILSREFYNNRKYNVKHPLRELEIFIENNFEKLNNEDLESLIYHLILSNIMIKYKVIFKDFFCKTNELIQDKEMYMKNLSEKAVEQMELMIKYYNENILLCNKF